MQKIYYRNKGGIGNQLFIYSFAKSISLRYDKKLYIDNTTGFKKDFYKRIPSVNFVIEDKMTEAGFLIKFLFRIHKFFPSSILNFLGLKVINELSNRELLNLNLENLKKFSIILAEGYFQSYKYFEDYKDEIIKNSFVGYIVCESYVFYYDLIRNSKSASIHVRRYQYDNLLDFEYYKKAINIISNKEEDIKFFIFTDDILWCKQNFTDSSFIIVDVDNSNEIQELFLMSLCNHNIIANSSFSWWAAFLSKQNDKIIIAPEYTQIGVVDNFYPKEWILIN